MWWMDYLEHGIKLKKHTLEEEIDPPMTVYRLKLEAIDAYGMPKEIFLYHEGPDDPTNNQLKRVLDRVCNTRDLVDYPAYEPDPNLPDQFFRLDFIDLLFYNLDELEETYNLIIRDINLLIESIYKIQKLKEEEVIELGYKWQEPSSSEFSSSPSSSSSYTA